MTPQLSFNELIAAGLKLAGKPTHGARFGILLRQIDPSFSPAKYGFRTLRSALDAHPSLVSITHDGIDIVVAEPTPQYGPAQAPEEEVRQLRQDLWAAFSFINAGLARYYDRQTATIISFPRAASPDEAEAFRELRSSVANEATRFVEITPFPPDAQRELARTFVNGLDAGDPRRSALEQSLAKLLWFREFIATIRQHPELESTWRRRRSAAVLAHVRAWMAANDVKIDSLYSESRPSAVVAATTPPATTNTAVRVPDPPTTEPIRRTGSVRERILLAISRMPTSALLTIPIPSQYFFDELN